MTELIDAIVAGRRPLAQDIIELRLQRADGTALPPFEAGAHLDIEVRPGLLRQYSLCSRPGSGEHRVAILREAAGRGGSAAAHERLQPGVALRVSAPRNHFALMDDDAPALLFAGGIGITPLLAMAQVLHAQGRPFTLHYAARSPERMAFAHELRSATWRDRVHLYVDTQGQQVDVASALAAFAGRDPHVYVCGPQGFIATVTAAAGAAGCPPARLHVEHFTPPAAATGAERAFTVCLARSGLQAEVPADRSIAEVLEDLGVALNLSCEAGVCGSCLTPVLSGTPDHRDTVMTAAERAANRRITICCSRSFTDTLELDL